MTINLVIAKHYRVLFFLFSSAWIKPENMYDYVQNKNKFGSKNRSETFLVAIKEADEAVDKANQIAKQDTMIQHDPQNMAGSISSPSGKITVKTLNLKDLLETFKENEATLRSIFNERRTKLERFNYGAGYDFLTVLSRTATPEQQKQMYSYMCEALAGKKYYDRPIYENLLWSIILPEWLIRICMKTFSRTKSQIIDQIKKDEDDSINDNSLDLSIDL